MPNIPQSDLSPPKSWDEFEDIVADLYARLWGEPHVERYGRSGQAQQGVDIYSQPPHLDGDYVGIQCKRYAVGTLTRAIVEDEIEKAENFTPPLAEYIIATTDRRDAKLQQAVREINEERRAAGQFPVRIVFWEDICSLLTKPSHREVLCKHYGEWLAQIQPAAQSLHQIPEPTATFKGRKKELDELTEAIREGSVAISGVRGMGGIGKTALALKLAQRLADDYPDAQLFIDLNGTSRSPMRPEQAMIHVIHAFRPQIEIPTAESELSGLYRSVLHGKRALLLLDDAAGAGQVEPLLPPSTCALLVTSRRRFRLAGMHALNLDTLDEETARELLCAIAPRIGDHAAEIAELCGRLPLALELSASALAERVDLAPAEYARRLRDERTRLDLVDASLSLSYELLDEELQRLWARLAVFSIPFEREAAAAVWEMAEDPAHDQLGELLRYSLVKWKGEIGRYQLHDLARVFAYARLEEREDPRTVHRLAAEYFETRFIEEQRPVTPEEALEWVDQWEQSESWENFAQSARDLFASLGQLGYWNESRERLERALTVVEIHLNDPILQAAILNDLGMIAESQADWERATGFLEKALAIGEDQNALAGIAQTYMNLGNVHLKKGEWTRSIEFHEKSLTIKERLYDVRGVAQSYLNLGNTYYQKGEWNRATQCYECALEKMEQVDDAHGGALCYDNLGIIHTERGEWDQAIELHNKALKIIQEASTVRGLAKVYMNLSDVYLAKGEWDKAIYFCQRALEIMEQWEDIYNIARIHMRLGSIHKLKGEWKQALNFLEKALAEMGQISDVHGVAEAYSNLGNVYARKGAWDRAIELYEKSLDMMEQLGDILSIARTYNNLGGVYADKGQWEQAMELYEEAKVIMEEIGYAPGVAQTYNNLCSVYLDRGEWDQAQEFCEEAVEMMEEIGDLHGMAQAYNNLSGVYASKKKWNLALGLCREAVETMKQLGDVYGMASVLTNIGLIYLRAGRAEEAKPPLARACMVLSQIGASEVEKAIGLLAQACGSVEAANAYLARQSESSEEEGGSPDA